MGFGVNLGGLWKSPTGAKSVCSGKFNFPVALMLDSSRGHKFVITRRQKQKENEPDYDLWLFPKDDKANYGSGLDVFDEQQPHDNAADDSGDGVPF